MVLFATVVPPVAVALLVVRAPPTADVPPVAVALLVVRAPPTADVPPFAVTLLVARVPPVVAVPPFADEPPNMDDPPATVNVSLWVPPEATPPLAEAPPAFDVDRVRGLYPPAPDVPPGTDDVVGWEKLPPEASSPPAPLSGCRLGSPEQPTMAVARSVAPYNVRRFARRAYQ